MGKGMFKTKRLPDGARTRIKVQFAEWETIKGDADFVTPLFQEVCETHEFKNALAAALTDTTKEEIVKEMRRGGWPKSAIKEFEKGEFWPELVDGE